MKTIHLLTIIIGSFIAHNNYAGERHTKKRVREENTEEAPHHVIKRQQPALEKKLRRAAKHGNTSKIKALLTSPCLQLNSTNSRGNTALHKAVLYKKTTAARLLLCHPDTDPNIKSNRGFTPLHLAALDGSGRLIKTLMHHGADPRIRTPEGNSAIHLLENRGKHNWVKQLYKWLDMQAIKNNEVCCVCLEEPENIILTDDNDLQITPCCHAALCIKDKEQCREFNFPCPNCREPIE